MNFIKYFRFWAVVVFSAAWPLLAVGQDFPSKTVKIIVPHSPGAGTDLIARVIVDKLADKWNQTIVVENRAGANGIIGSQQLVGAKPDGYTLLLQGATHVTNQFTQKELPYDTLKSFTPLGLIATSPYVLVVSPQSKATDLQQVLADVRGSSKGNAIGVGDNSTRLVGGVIGVRAKTGVLLVPYQGGAPMLTDLMGGHVSFGISSISSTYAAHNSGKLKIVAVLNNERSQALPTIPTANEQGLPGDFPTYWFGLFGPANMDEALADKISKDFAEVLSLPDVRSRFVSLGIEPVGNTPKQFDERIKSDLKLWDDLIEQTGLRMDQ